MSTPVSRPKEYFQGYYVYGYTPPEQMWQDLLNSVRWRLDEISADDIKGFNQITSGIIGVYDPGKVPADYNTFDSNKSARFLVQNTAPFVASEDWGGLELTQEDIDRFTRVYFVWETDGVWTKYTELSETPKSEYDIYLETTSDNPVLSKAEWLESRKGIVPSNVSFDGENMIYSDLSFDHTEDLTTWGTFIGSTVTGGVATVAYSGGAEHQVVFKDNTFLPGRKVELTINVIQNSGRCRLLVDDSNPADIFVDVDLKIGINKVRFDHTGRTDTTVIIRQETEGQTKVNLVSVSYYTINPVEIPLNSAESNYFLTKTDWPIASAFGSAVLTKGETLEIEQPGTATLLYSGVSFNKFTLNENAETCLIYREVTSAEFYFGFNSINANIYKHYVMVGYSGGHLRIRTRDASFNIPVTHPYNLGDRLKIGLRRNGLKYRFSIYNLDKGWTASENIQCSPEGLPFVAHNTSSIALTTVSGKIEVIDSTQLCFSRNQIEKLIVGDSTTFGQSATTEQGRWASMITGKTQVMGGGADGIWEMKYLLQEILFLNPKKVLIMLTGNDFLFLRNPAAEYYSFRNAIVNAGIEVVHLFPTPREHANSVISMLLGPELRNDVKIDTNTPLRQNPLNAEILASIYNSGDALHPNDAAQPVIAGTINDNV